MYVCVSVPDRQYEVRVWAFNKQIDGAAAVWKGRTDKTPGISNISLCMFACIHELIHKCPEKKCNNVLKWMCAWYSIITTKAPTSIAPKQHPSHGQQLHLHLASMGKAKVQQRPDHQLHGALQPGRDHQRLLGLLSHKVRDPVDQLNVIMFVKFKMQQPGYVGT